MDDSCVTNNTLSLDSFLCRVGKGDFPEIPRGEAAYVTRTCNRKLHISSCKNPHLTDFIADAGGFDVMIKQVTGSDLVLPSYIPIIDAVSAKYDIDILGTSIIGVRLKDVFPTAVYHHAGTMRYTDNPPIKLDHVKQPSFVGKSKILFSDGPDNLIEPLWYARSDLNLFEALNTMGFVAITGADFSLFHGECPVGQILNINKSLLYSVLTEKAGTPSIPHIFAVTPYQHSLLANWLDRQKHLKIVCINAQLQRNYNDIKQLQDTIRFLINNTRQDLHIILHGYPLSRRYLEGIFDLMPYLHFADVAPCKLAHSKLMQIYDKDDRCLKVKYRPDLDEKTCIASNIEARQLFVLDQSRKNTGDSSNIKSFYRSLPSKYPFKRRINPKKIRIY